MEFCEKLLAQDGASESGAHYQFPCRAFINSQLSPNRTLHPLLCDKINSFFIKANPCGMIIYLY